MGVVILGMHRSGTSLLIGLLQEYGYQLGDVSNQTSRFKPTGTKENLAIRRVNNEILQLNGCSWNHPIENLIINEVIANKMKDISLKKNKWAVKDPRMVLTYDYWSPYLPKHKLIATIRSPLEVARSLKLKNGLPLKEGIEVWFIYNKILLNHWQKYKFPILNFNLNKQDYYQQFQNLSDYLGIECISEKFNRFYQHTTPAQDIDKEKLGSSIVGLHNKLLKISMNSYYDS